MEPRKKREWGSLRVCDSGGHTKALIRLGVAVRPGSESTAKRRRGFPGSWESLLSPRIKCREWARPTYQSPGSSVRSRRLGSEPDEQSEVSKTENKGQEMDRGSLSISIVATESWETDLREPVSSKGGYRDTDSSPETHIGH